MGGEGAKIEIKEKPFNRHIDVYANDDGSEVCVLLEWEHEDFPFIICKGMGNNLFAAMLACCINLGKPEQRLYEAYSSVFRTAHAN